MRESKFQSELIKELNSLFQGCVILKNDSNYIQGFPDLLILFEDKWAALETKRSDANSIGFRPNQKYYIRKLNTMSFASFINPENKERVLYELQQAFGSNR